MKRQQNTFEVTSKISAGNGAREFALDLKSELEIESHLTSEFLLEHLEGELDASLQDDLELLLMNSVADRRVLKSLEQTRELLRSSDDVLMPEDGRFYERMHANIMSAIMDESVISNAESAIESGDDFGRAVRSSNSGARERVI